MTPRGYDVSSLRKMSQEFNQEEMDKDLENMDNFIDNIESYPPPSKSREYSFLRKFLWGALFGSVITYAIGATVVFNLLERDSLPTCELKETEDGEFGYVGPNPCFYTTHPYLDLLVK